MKKIKRVSTYLKEVQFSRILIKYFLILFMVLVLPIIAFNEMYQYEKEKEFQYRMIEKNEQSLYQTYSVVNATILSVKNTVYNIAQNKNVKYVATKSYFEADENANNMVDMFNIIKVSSDYLNTVGVWLTKSQNVITSNGLIPKEMYDDAGIFELYENMENNRIKYVVRKKNDVYPYLLTILCPINVGSGGDWGMAFINIDMEMLGKYLGTGRYRTKDDSSTLLIFEEETGKIIYSDEYRFWKLEEDKMQELWRCVSREGENYSGITNWNEKKYIISSMVSEEGFIYVYMNPFKPVSSSVLITEVYSKLVVISLALCIIVAFVFACWIYRPIRRTVKLLDDFSMLVEWDDNSNLNEIESIQRSIIKIKEKNDTQNEMLKERMINLHHAQIRALQAQINPHFIYNCLESIGNLSVLMMGKENSVTDALYTLGQLMRISLSGKNYLVSLDEEIEHVNIYIRMLEEIEPEFKKRVQLHFDIPEEMKSERILKLTLQPLIENALEHGFSGKRREGNIWINGEKKGDINFLRIMDDGVGVTKEQLERLNENLKESSIADSKHIGLRNVNQRIKLVYGEAFGVSVEQTDKFIITIKFKTM